MKVSVSPTARSGRLRRVRNAVGAVAVTAALAVGSASPAFADDSTNTLANVGVSAGSPFGVVRPDSSWDLVTSGFTLNQVDPLSGGVVGTDANAALTADYLMSVDLMTTSQMAFDASELARRAQAEAEARRLAALRSGNGKLKPGTVPAPYDRILENAITACPGLPVGVVAAQLKQESGFNPKAVSPAGAQGIAQFLPGTWKTEGVDGNGDGKADIWNPEDAIPSAVSFDCKLLEAVKKVSSSEDPVRLMLAAYNAGLGAVQKYNGIPPFAETRNYVTIIMTSSADFADPAGQTEVGPDGCPSSVPANTLRNGAEGVGAAKLCADSVAQARTPQAATAIKYVFAHLGTPYSQARRNETGWYDCSSYVSRAYQSAGVPIAPAGKNAPVTSTLSAGENGHTHQIGYTDKRPGDIIFPSPGHVGMVLANGYMIHTNQDGDVSHVRSLYPDTSTWLVMRVD